MRKELFSTYLRMILEELNEEEVLDEEGAAASGGGNAMSAGGVAGYVLPLGASNFPNKRSKKRSHKK
jgi:hypothetical protein